MRRTRWATVWVSLLGAAILALPMLAGCGDVDAGNTPFAGTVVYADPAGAYQLNLLEPPWIPASIEGAAVFVVPPTDLTDITDLSTALYSLHIDTVPGGAKKTRDSEESSVFATATTPAQTLQIVEAELQTVSGLTAYELSWQPATAIFERDVFLAGPSTATFRLQFGAKAPLGADEMVTQMILSFEPL